MNWQDYGMMACIYGLPLFLIVLAFVRNKPIYRLIGMLVLAVGIFVRETAIISFVRNMSERVPVTANMANSYLDGGRAVADYANSTLVYVYPVLLLLVILCAGSFQSEKGREAR